MSDTITKTTQVIKDGTQIKSGIINEVIMEHPDFLKLVYIPVIIWFTGIIIVFIILLRKYTFADWTNKTNPYAGESFGMPRGIFRGIVTLTLLFVVILFEVINVKVRGDFEKEVEQLLLAFQMMIAFYFGSKVMHHMASTDQKKTKTVAESMVAAKSSAGSKSSFDDPEAAG